MEIYETEEQQVEALKRWWQENRNSTIAGVLTAIIGIGGFNYWKDYQQEQKLQASALYDEVLVAVQQNRHDSVDKLQQRLNQDYSSSAYATYASLLLAKSKVTNGDLDGAQTVLQEVLKKTGNSEIGHVARIRLIKIMQAKGEFEQGLQLIAEADTKAEGFAPTYDELTGDLYVALDRLGEARTAYQRALRAGLRSPLLQFKLDDITAAEVVANPEPS
jgi:predicted negative regulator of RcsB-dependent stress response